MNPGSLFENNFRCGCIKTSVVTCAQTLKFICENAAIVLFFSQRYSVLMYLYMYVNTHLCLHPRREYALCMHMHSPTHPYKIYINT